MRSLRPGAVLALLAGSGGGPSRIPSSGAGPGAAPSSRVHACRLSGE